MGEKIEREIVAKRDRTNSQSTYESLPAERDESIDTLNDSVNSNNGCSHLSSDEEFQTATELSNIHNLTDISQDDFFQWGKFLFKDLISEIFLLI